jgi:Flp pilus assembly protein TadG
MKPSTSRLRRTSVFRLLHDRRGAMLVIAAGSLTAMMGALALAVDVGLLYTAKGEAQKAADAAALAGAASFIEDPGDADAAKLLAEQVGEQNVVSQEAVQIETAEDVAVDVALQRVTVTVRRTAARGNPVSTYFARVLGITSVDVEAIATGEAFTVGSASCVKPFAPPDGFRDENGNGKYDGTDYYNTAETGFGSNERNGQPSDNGVDSKGTTYLRDFGRPIVLKEGKPGDVWTPSQYFPITLPEPGGGFTSGASDYRDAIANCRSATIHIGDVIPTEPGRMVGPTKQGMTDLIAQDPGANWGLAANGVSGSRYDPWRASPRVINIPLFDPDQAPSSGRKDIHVANVSAFWVERMEGNDVVGRFMFASGSAVGGPGGPGGGGVGPALMAVRLIR